MSQFKFSHLFVATTLVLSFFSAASAIADDGGSQIGDHRCRDYIRGCHFQVPWHPGGTQQNPNFSNHFADLNNFGTLQQAEQANPVAPPPMHPLHPMRPQNFPQLVIETGLGQGQFSISCKQGRSIVRQQGFHHVQIANCGQYPFMYSAKTGAYSGASISVNANGKIVGTNYWIAKN